MVPVSNNNGSGAGGSTSEMNSSSDGGRQEPNEARQAKQDNSPRKFWTKEEAQRVMQLYDEGKTFEAIAEELPGRTIDAVKEFFYRYNEVPPASENQKHDNGQVSSKSVFKDRTNVAKEEPTHVSQSPPKDSSRAAIENKNNDQIEPTASPRKILVKRSVPKNHTSEAEEYPKRLKPHVNNDPTQVVCDLNGQSGSQPLLILDQNGPSSRETLQHPSPMPILQDMAVADGVDSVSHLAGNETASQGYVDDAPIETVSAECLPGSSERVENSKTGGCDFLDLGTDSNWELDQINMSQEDRMVHGAQ